MQQTTSPTFETIRTWLAATCKVHQSIAVQLASELVNTCGVTDLEQLQFLREVNPKWLDEVECKLSPIAKILINSGVEKIGRIPLHTLTTDDVGAVITTCFSDSSYSKCLQENQINGFSLLYVESVDDLAQLGMTHPVHTRTLLSSIKEWRRVGVPASYLRLSEEEKWRRSVSIKQESSISDCSRDATSSNSTAGNLLAIGASAVSGNAGQHKRRRDDPATVDVVDYADDRGGPEKIQRNCASEHMPQAFAREPFAAPGPPTVLSGTISSSSGVTSSTSALPITEPAGMAEAAVESGVSGSEQKGLDNTASRPRRVSAQRAMTAIQSTGGTGPRLRRSIASHSSSGAEPTQSAAGGSDVNTFYPVPGDLPPRLVASYQGMCAACAQLLCSDDEKVLQTAVAQVVNVIAKARVAFVEYILSSGTFVKLLRFVEGQGGYNQTFICQVLRAIYLIIPKLLSCQYQLIFKAQRFHCILRACLSDAYFVREQALRVVFLLGGQEHGLKQLVLEALGAPFIAKSYFTAAEVFLDDKKIRVRSHCLAALFQLASFCTPHQYSYFIVALPMLHDLLASADAPQENVDDSLQTLSHLVHASAQLPQGLETFFSKPHQFFETALRILQDKRYNSDVRWSACSFVWSVVQHSGAEHVRHLLRVTGILGQIFIDEKVDVNVRAGALNTLQVLLQRGEVFVEQFVHHRDALASHVIERVRSYEHKELVCEGKRSADANTIMKYASFLLANAVLYGNEEQLKKLLDKGVYPLLFKIAALEGEEDKPEEAKMRAASALHRLLQVCPDVLITHQERAARRRFDVQASWSNVRSLIDEVADGDSGADESGDDAGAGEQGHREGESGDVPVLRWSKALRDCVGEVVVIAERLGLCES